MLLRYTMLVCLLPASFFYGKGNWIKKLVQGKLFFASLLEEYHEVLKSVEHRSRMTRVLVKGPLCIAVSLHRTRSYKKTVRHVFRVMGGDAAFPDSLSGYHVIPVVTETEDQRNLYQEYVNFFTDRNASEESSDFVPLSEECCSFDHIKTKLIAFYLPQFHTFPLNDEWYGRGFTEWTNVTKAIPQYTGHYQPQLPIDTGYYDLNDINVIKRQVELAKLYGIYAFCFHYYWFSGSRLMEMPIFKWLEHPEIDFPFCLNWANENWSKLWDGGNKEVRYKQELHDGDDERFFDDILPFLKDPRYIQVDGKPVLIIYRPHLFEQRRFIRFADIVRKKAVEHGFAGLFMISVNSHNFEEDPTKWGLDAMLEFPPHCLLRHGLQPKELNFFVNPHFYGHVWDGGEYVEKRRFLYETDYKLFKGVCPSWDNTPRKAYSNGSVFDGITPAHYRQWLNDCIKFTRAYHRENEQFIFINAWNEWAEGAHLEPDSRYGYAYLQATREALLAGDGK